MKFQKKIFKKNFGRGWVFGDGVCRGGRGLLDGETGVQGARFDRCNVAQRPFVPLQTV